MAAYRRLYNSRRLQAVCQEPGSDPAIEITFLYQNMLFRS